MWTHVRSRPKSFVAAAVAAIACAAGVIGASGCGSASVFDPVAKAATNSTSAAGFRMTFSFQMSSPGLPMNFTGTGTGSFDLRDRAGSVGFDMSLGNSPQVAQLLGGTNLHLQEVIKGLTIYMKLPSALTDRLPGARPWMKIDLAKTAAAAGVPGLSSLAGNPISGDPSQFLHYLRAMSGSVSDLGPDRVGGIPTTHYRGQVDLNRVAGALPGSSKQTIAALQQMIHVKSLPVDVWVDHQQLVRQIRFSFNAPVAGAQTLDVVMTLDITHYGPEPAPTLPSPGQVTDAGSLLGASG